MRKIWKATMAACVLCMGVGVVAGAQLESILKAGGVAVVVDRFGKDINKFINTLTGEKNVGPLQETKVVPIISIGDGGFVGAVQVSGPDQQVKKVREREASVRCDRTTERQRSDSALGWSYGWVRPMARIVRHWDSHSIFRVRSISAWKRPYPPHPEYCCSATGRYA